MIVEEEPELVDVIVSPGGRTVVEDEPDPVGATVSPGEDAPGGRMDPEAVGIGTDLG